MRVGLFVPPLRGENKETLRLESSPPLNFRVKVKGARKFGAADFVSASGADSSLARPPPPFLCMLLDVFPCSEIREPTT